MCTHESALTELPFRALAKATFVGANTVRRALVSLSKLIISSPNDVLRLLRNIEDRLLRAKRTCRAVLPRQAFSDVVSWSPDMHLCSRKHRTSTSK